jgi:predicted nucleic acid-binding protein
MSVFIDSNILLISAQPSHAMHERAVRTVASFIERGEDAVLTPQIVAEFWNGATRPADHNGLGMSHERARDELTRIESFSSLMSESPQSYGEWKRLVTEYRVSGVKVHDARLVAAMRVYGVPRILAFNVDDFKRYDDIIEVVLPV